jgi:hypothetical protein
MGMIATGGSGVKIIDPFDSMNMDMIGCETKTEPGEILSEKDEL